MSLLPEQTIRVQIPDPPPPILTQRLLLRPLADSDAEDLFAIRSRPEVARTNYPKTPHQSVQETREWMASKIFTAGPENLIGRHFTYVLIERGQSESDIERLLAGGQVIGYVGINEVYPSPEIGYSIHPDFWGKGYATEALEGLLKAWWEMPRPRREDLDERVERVFAICEKINVGSSRVLSKCGLKVSQDMAFEEDELLLWELERPDIEASC
ncbi:GNAT domain-containing protein [Aspergillus floccosus]